MTRIGSLTKLLAIAISLHLAATQATAADYRIEAVAEAPAPEGLADEIAKGLSTAGLKVVRGTRTYCEIWVNKDLAVAADFAPTDTVLYPLQVGQLVGAMRLKSKAEDFRGQPIKTGVYTLRYGQQPVDGNHVGTSPTRDFLLFDSCGQERHVDRTSRAGRPVQGECHGG